MATANPPAEQTADLFQKLSLDSQTKTPEVTDASKKSGDLNGSIQSSDRSLTPLLPEFMDTTMCYYPGGYPAYLYGGYNGSYGEWDDPSRYVSPDGSGVYSDNAALMYSGYGYQPYGPYSPGGGVPTMGHDGQLYGPQQYQYPAPYYQPQTPSGPYVPNQTLATQGDGATPVAADQPVETATGNVKASGNGDINGSMPLKANNPNTSLTSNGSSGKGVFNGSLPNSGYQDPRFKVDGMRSPVPWIDGSAFTDGQHRPATSSSLSSTYSRANNFQLGKNQSLQPLPNYMGSGMGQNPGYVNRMYPPNNRFYGQYGVPARTGAFGSNGYDYRNNSRGWFGADGKYKPKGRSNGFFGYGNENMDGFNELSRGPRARGFKNQKGDAPSITLAARGQDISSQVNNQEKDNSSQVNNQEKDNLSQVSTQEKDNSSQVSNQEKDNSSQVNNQEKDNSAPVPEREQYNREDFLVSYTEAKFFIIKSYSEDDVHKSIKYSVWASTPNGNKKLDAGYREAQNITGGCPVFLFFSVNTSGQFVGVAEMVGPVDFNKTLEYWQQDKWNGCFPVKWHIVKDVPNSLLKHITLENNDNKPVTNSRDTQEVKLEQGIQMLKIFKEYSSKACILDDFPFYEGRQKTVQEKKAKQLQASKQQQASERKPIDAIVSGENDGGDGIGQPKLQNPLEDGLAIPNQAIASHVNGEHTVPGEGELVGDRDGSKGAKTVTVVEKKVAVDRDFLKDVQQVPVTEKRVVVNGVANGY